MVQDGTGVYCQQCCTQKIAEVSPDAGLVVRSHAHGRAHEVALEPLAVLERLAGTQDGSAIMSYVRCVVGSL